MPSYTIAMFGSLSAGSLVIGTWLFLGWRKQSYVPVGLGFAAIFFLSVPFGLALLIFGFLGASQIPL